MSVPVSDPRPSPPSPATAGAPALRGRMGAVELSLTVLAFAAPLASVVGVLPLVVMFAGSGAPLAFVAATAVLLLFSVGYVTMSRHLPNPGAYYAYVSAGINRTLGLASSFLAVLGYLMIGLGVTLFFGIVAQDLVAGTFHGPTLDWWLYSLALVAAVGVFGYLRIDLSAKVLSLVMVLEIAIVLIFDLAVAADGGPEGRTLAPFAWSSLSEGSVGVSILFAVITFIGFEATAVFRDEVRDPARTIPRATYLSVTLIGLFYALTTWLLILAYGSSAAPAAAGSNPAGMFTDALERYVGSWAYDVISVLVVTSGFAAVLSCQNIIARYGHALGTDRALPRPLGRVHPRHGSPYVSSLVLTLVLAAGVLSSAGSDPAVTYAWMAGAGGFPLLLLMFLTSVSVVVFFRRSATRVDGATRWHTQIAPVLAALGMGAALYLAATNFVDLAGGSTGTAVALQFVIWSVFAAGLLLGIYYRKRRPEVYERIGRRSLDE